jgi:uncharacterized membrane protein
MTAAVDVLTGLVVVASAIVAGVFFAVAVSVLPALFAMPMGQYVEIHRMLGKGYHPAMPVLVTAAIVTEVLLAILAPSAATLGCYAVATASLLGVSVVSHRCNVPINREIAAIGDQLPTGWDPRPRWRNWHRLRLGFAFAVLGLNISALALL